jgi:two-component system, chemotaxis family, protein-glutamate methylesterase/glutaminase
MSTRVLVVDDTIVFRRVVSDALSGLPGVEVVGTAVNGKLALAQLATLRPDLITLDIEMPEMNGIEVLQALAASGSKPSERRSPDLVPGVIVLSSLTVRGGEMTIRALELGAFDFITKPEGTSREDSLAVLRACMQPVIRAFQRRQERRATGEQKIAEHKLPELKSLDKPTIAPARLMRRTGSPIVLIGVSTGGPSALAEVLPALPANIGAPVFIVQHMPPLFTHALAERLQTKSAIRVKEAVHGEIAVAGCAYIAPGGRQMKLAPGPAGEILIQITDDPPENNCRPAVDYLFRSAALHFPGRCIAAILTGMGNDGTQGLRLLKRGGCPTIAQDEASSVVFGMPREAIQAGVIDTIAPLSKIASALLKCLGEARL